jgi:hypothetical protein
VTHEVFHYSDRRSYVIQPRPVGMPERVPSNPLAKSRADESQLIAGCPQVATITEFVQ